MIKKQKGMAKGICVRLAGLTLSAALILGCSGFAFAVPNAVTIWESGKEPVQVTTTDRTVGRILSKNGIVLGENDRVNRALTDDVSSGEVIEIYRAVDVNINNGGKMMVCSTSATYVGDVLKEAGIRPDADDVVLPSLKTAVLPGMSIQVIQNDVQEITVQETLPYVIREEEDPSLYMGERVVAQAGQEGIKEYKYRITYQNGAETSRELLNETVLAEAADEVVLCGTQPAPSTFEIGKIPAAKDFQYTRMEQFQATAYDLSFESCGKYPGDPYYGITSWGVKARYGVVAVDPKVIPYGTKMYIESADGQYVYGYAVAGDCGGAIKNKRIDLFYNTHAECMNFGRRTINVYFLDEPPATRDEVGR